MDVNPDELAKTYSEYTDEKLLSMASSGDLTEVAAEVLENELSKRGIPFPQATKEDQVAKKPKMNRLSLVSGVCGALMIVVYMVIAIISALYPPSPQLGYPLYGPVAGPLILFGSGAILLLALTAVITGIVALAQRKSKRVEKERGYGWAVFGLIAGALQFIGFFWGIYDQQEYVTYHLESHMALVNSPHLVAIKKNRRILIEQVSTTTFLAKKAGETDNALAPCALLTNAILSTQVLNLERRIALEKQFPAPLQGTNILGMYDDVIAAGEFFDQPPEIQAEMIARMHIYWSGGFDIGLNRFIHGLTQSQCLEHLLITDLETLAELLYGQEDTIGALYKSIHLAPVAIHGSTYTPEELELYLGELKNPGSLELAADATDNPVMPCSLLKAYMSASNIENWFEELRTNHLVVPSRDWPFISEYRELLFDGVIPTTDPVVTTRVTVAYFANRIVHFDRQINELVSPLNQRQCLEEFINPGPVYDQLGR